MLLPSRSSPVHRSEVEAFVTCHSDGLLDSSMQEVGIVVMEASLVIDGQQDQKEEHMSDAVLQKGEEDSIQAKQCQYCK